MNMQAASATGKAINHLEGAGQQIKVLQEWALETGDKDRSTAYAGILVDLTEAVNQLRPDLAGEQLPAVEASSLGWTAGQWPFEFNLERPNGEIILLRRSSLSVEGARYASRDGRHRLTVFND
jgi:hypothetical protein